MNELVIIQWASKKLKYEFNVIYFTKQQLTSLWSLKEFIPILTLFKIKIYRKI